MQCLQDFVTRVQLKKMTYLHFYLQFKLDLNKKHWMDGRIH